MSDFILSEAEVRLAINKLTRVAWELSCSIDTYVGIINDMQAREGIKSERIEAQLEDIKSYVKLNQKDIALLQEDIVKKVLEPALHSVEQADNFQFPTDWFTNVTSFLSQFVR